MNNNGSFYLCAVEPHGVALTTTSARPSVDSRAPGLAGFCRAGAEQLSGAPLHPSLGGKDCSREEGGVREAATKQQGGGRDRFVPAASRTQAGWVS